MSNRWRMKVSGRPCFGIDPIEVRGQSPRQSDRDDLRKFVRMSRSDRRFELGVAAAGGLDEHREFLGVFGLAFPAIDGTARREDIDARGEALFHELVRELRRAAAVGQIGDDEIGVRGLQAVSLIPGTPSRAVEYRNRTPSSAFMRRLERRRDSLMKESSSGGSRRAASSREMRGGRASPLRSATMSKNSPIFMGPSSLAL